jgi:hypothetical protein
MSAPDQVTSNQAEAAAPQGVSGQREGLSLRARYRRNWLLRLAYLPPQLHRGAVERLARGETAAAMGRWILRHPNRGGLSKITSEETIRRYVSVLAIGCARSRRHYAKSCILTCA